MKLLPRKPIDADDNIGRGMDLALVTLVFLGIGYVLDRWLGTRPLFMITLFLLAAVGQFVKLWFGYEAKMKLLEAERAEMSQVRASQDQRG